jgi:hypothetical protein
MVVPSEKTTPTTILLAVSASAASAASAEKSCHIEFYWLVIGN